MKNKKRKICVALGTRPEIIKLAPVIRELKKRKMDFFVIHTGQHYSNEMDSLIFSDLQLDLPKYNLKIGSGGHSAQTAAILIKATEVLEKENPDLVIVQGDTNTGMAVALSAAKLHIPVAHIEAGLRSYDTRMPEEINRIIMDHISSLLFTPTLKSKDILIKEGIRKSQVFNVGNTVVDTVLQNVKIANAKSTILQKLKLISNNYCLITLHRPENVDDKKRLLEILKGLTVLTKKSDLVFIWPMHPRTAKNIQEFKYQSILNLIPKLKVISPIGFLDFLKLQSSAKIILTDSGGIQEEACILKIPCLTLRDNTERPESIIVGANILTTPSPHDLINNFNKMLNKKRKWKNPFGDGKSALKIVDRI